MPHHTHTKQNYWAYHKLERQIKYALYEWLIFLSSCRTSSA